MVLGGRYEITAQIIVTAETDMILDGMDQILSRVKCRWSLRPRHAATILRTTRVCSMRATPTVSRCSIALSPPKGNKYLITSYTAPLCCWMRC